MTTLPSNFRIVNDFEEAKLLQGAGLLTSFIEGVRENVHDSYANDFRCPWIEDWDELSWNARSNIYGVFVEE